MTVLARLNAELTASVEAALSFGPAEYYNGFDIRPVPGVPRKGQLNYVGEKPLGRDYYHWWKCADCGSVYPQINGNAGPSANGKVLTVCLCAAPDTTWGRP